MPVDRFLLDYCSVDLIADERDSAVSPVEPEPANSQLRSENRVKQPKASRDVPQSRLVDTGSDFMYEAGRSETVVRGGLFPKLLGLSDRPPVANIDTPARLHREIKDLSMSSVSGSLAAAT